LARPVRSQNGGLARHWARPARRGSLEGAHGHGTGTRPPGARRTAGRRARPGESRAKGRVPGAPLVLGLDLTQGRGGAFTEAVTAAWPRTEGLAPQYVGQTSAGLRLWATFREAYRDEQTRHGRDLKRADRWSISRSPSWTVWRAIAAGILFNVRRSRRFLHGPYMVGILLSSKSVRAVDSSGTRFGTGRVSRRALRVTTLCYRVRFGPTEFKPRAGRGVPNRREEKNGWITPSQGPRSRCAFGGGFYRGHGWVKKAAVVPGGWANRHRPRSCRELCPYTSGDQMARRTGRFESSVRKPVIAVSRLWNGILY